MESLQQYAQKHIKGYNTWSTSSKSHKLWFAVDKYLINNKGFGREQMPQIDFEEFMKVLEDLSKVTKITTLLVHVTELQPTQNEINISKVLRKIAEGKTVDKDYIYITDKNGFILDGHHRHVQTLIQDKHRKVRTIRFDELPIEELVYMFTEVVDAEKRDIDDNVIESYGSGDMPGTSMGAVVLPITVTSTGAAMDSANHGSVDMPGTQKKKKYSVNKATGERFEIDDTINVLDLPLDETHPLYNVMDLKNK